MNIIMKSSAVAESELLVNIIMKSSAVAESELLVNITMKLSGVAQSELLVNIIMKSSAVAQFELLVNIIMKSCAVAQSELLVNIIMKSCGNYLNLNKVEPCKTGLLPDLTKITFFSLQAMVAFKYFHEIILLTYCWQNFIIHNHDTWIC